MMGQKPINARVILFLPPLLAPLAADEAPTPKPLQSLEPGRRNLTLRVPPTVQPQGH